MRSASITCVLVPMFLACATCAAEPAPAKTPAPAVKPAVTKAAPAAEQKKNETKTGIGIPGEVLLRTPSLEATWQNYRGRLALYSVTDRRTDEPLLIGQDAFVIVFTDGSMLRSSEMKAGSSALEVLKPNAVGASAGERAGGRKVSVALSDEKTSVAAKWACTHRNGSDYLRQTITLSATKAVEIADLRLTAIQLADAQDVRAGDAAAASSGSLFFGVENAGSATTIDGAKVHTGIKKPVKLAPGQAIEIATLIGAAAAGQSADAFKAVLANEKKAAPVVTKKEEKKAAKAELKKEEPKKEQPQAVAVKKEEPKKEQPKTVAVKKEEPKKEQPKPVVAKKEDPKKETLPPAKTAPATPMTLDPNAPVPAGDTFRAVTAQSNDDAKAAAAAAKKKAAADAAAAQAKADAEKAKADAAKKKADADAAAAKAKADVEKTKAAASKKVEPQPKPVAERKKAEPAPKPAAKKPAYKFPDNLNPNAPVPLN